MTNVVGLFAAVMLFSLLGTEIALATMHEVPSLAALAHI
jgi:hypothetical protein